MSRSEDYLDHLLTSVTDKLDEFDDEFEQNRESLRESYQTQNDLPSKTQSALDDIREENFLREFEDEINKGRADDDFLSEFERELNAEPEDDFTQRLNREEVPLSEMDADLEDFFKEDVADDLFTGPGAGSGDDFLQNPIAAESAPMDDLGSSTVAMDDPDPVTMAMDDPGPSVLGMDDPATMAMDDANSSTVAMDNLDPVTMAMDDPGPSVLGMDDPVTMAMDNSGPSVLGMDDADSVTTAMGDTEPAAMGTDDLDIATMAADTEPVTMAVSEGAGALNSPAPNMGEDVVSKMAKEDQAMEAPKGMEGLEDIFGDILDEDADSLLSELEQGIAQSSGDIGMTQPQEPAADAGESLTDILNESDEDALSEIDRLLDADDGGQETQSAEEPLPMGPDFSFGESALGDEPEEKKKKERNKNGLFGKLSRVLFGTPEELDPDAAAEYEAAKAAMGPQEDPKVAKEKKKQEKELKKQQKKEEAALKKQEKDAEKAAKGAQKASKPKKEKKPKQKNKVPKEPPLPKVPVMMMWILALSIMVLVFLGTFLVGYSTPVKAAREAFENGDYVTAYAKLQGIKVRDADNELLESASTLAGIQTEMDAYHAMMEQKQYEMALDSLIRGYNRCLLHSAKAEEWGVADKVKELEDQFDQLLKEQFDISKRTAKKLYAIKKRSQYTLELHDILDKLGLEHK